MARMDTSPHRHEVAGLAAGHGPLPLPGHLAGPVPGQHAAQAVGLAGHGEFHVPQPLPVHPQGCGRPAAVPGSQRAAPAAPTPPRGGPPPGSAPTPAAVGGRGTPVCLGRPGHIPLPPGDRPPPGPAGPARRCTARRCAPPGAPSPPRRCRRSAGPRNRPPQTRRCPAPAAFTCTLAKKSSSPAWAAGSRQVTVKSPSSRRSLYSAASMMGTLSRRALYSWRSPAPGAARGRPAPRRSARWRRSGAPAFSGPA